MSFHKLLGRHLMVPETLRENGCATSVPVQLERKSSVLVSLIRHGQSDYNLWRYSSFSQLRFRDMFTFDPGIVDAPLSPAGNEQARQLAAQLHSKDPALYRHVSMIISSPLIRAIDTALMLFGTHKQYIKDATDVERGRPFPPITLLPLVTEWLSTKSDTGRSLDALREKYGENWQKLDDSCWKGLRLREDVWWYTPGQEQAHLINDAGLESKSSGRVGCTEADGLSFPNNLFRLIAPEPREFVTARAEALKSLIGVMNSRWIVIVGHAWFFKHLTGEGKMHNCEIRHYEYDVTKREFYRILEEDLLKVLRQDQQ